MRKFAMERARGELDRRTFLKKMLVAGIVSGAASSTLVRRVMAMGAGSCWKGSGKCRGRWQ